MGKVEITNEDKIFFPKSKITKGDVIAYFEKVANKMLPHLKNRPLSMNRFPNGITKDIFFQKNRPDYFPSWIKSAKLKKKGGGSIDMVLCNNKDTLIYLANQACLSPHLWLSTATCPDKPDKIIFDLDPPGKNFSIVMDAAYLLKDILEKDFKLKPFVMTTGSKGLHVVVFIKPELDFNKVRAFAKHVAQIAVDEDPKYFTVNPRKDARKGKLFIDYLRNSYAQHAIAPYALRAIEGAPVACPISWQQLTKSAHAQMVTLKNIGPALRKDPWSGFERSKKSIKSLSFDD